MGRSPKVLMVGPSRDSQGGITTVVNECFSVGLQEACDLTYLDCSCPGGKPRKLVCGVRSLAWARRHAREFDVAHVHVGGGNSFYRERFFVDAAVHSGVPCVLHLHDGLFKVLWEERADEALRAQIRETFELCARVVVLSTDIARYIEKNVSGGLDLRIVPNGVEVRESPSLPKERYTVLFLGHFDDNKNYDVLVRAMARVRERFPQAVCYLGADGDVEGFRRLVGKLGLEDACVHLGWAGREERQRMLDRCSIYCLPSKNEAMPMGLLEAMSNGLASVATPVGGMLDIVEDGTSGLFVPVGDEGALADAICALMADEPRRVAIAATGRKRVLEHFSLEGMACAYASLYEEVVREGNTR